MKRSFVLNLALAQVATTSLMRRNITDSLPAVELQYDGESQFHKLSNRAHSKSANWENIAGIAKGISVTEAKLIADQNPEITFFFYTKGCQMVLEREDASFGLFHHGDTIFFSEEPSWGTAPDLADGYEKLN